MVDVGRGLPLDALLCWQVPHYMAAQYLGALAGSGLVFLVYWDALVW